ncbi:MAG: hypothetical protein GX593_12980 [Actinomycetales bacterium]|nr:hypothetical protein [Actinomycetales bacterium]
MRGLAATVAVGVAALLAACTGPTPEPPSLADTLFGPLDRLYYDAKAQTDEEYFAQVATTEEAIAACMAEAGFEYLPATGNYSRISTQDLIANLPDAEEYAKEYGYGAVRNPGGSALEPPEDPNEAIRDALSPEAYDEYQLALHGPIAIWDGTGEMPETDSGCQSAAYEAAYPAEPDPLEQEILAEISRIETEAVPAHPDVAELDGRWAECMSDAGYPGLTSHRAARDGIWEQYLEHGGGAGEVGPDGMTESEREFLPIEIAQATADWQCRDSLGYDAAVTRVRDTLQQEFVDAHAPELEAWAARVQESQSK